MDNMTDREQFELFLRYKENKEIMREAICNHYRYGLALGLNRETLSREVWTMRDWYRTIKEDL